MKKLVLIAFCLIALAGYVSASNSASNYSMLLGQVNDGVQLHRLTMTDTGDVQNRVAGDSAYWSSTGTAVIEFNPDFLEPPNVQVTLNDTTLPVFLSVSGVNTDSCIVTVRAQSSVTHTIASARVDINGNVTQVIGGCTTGAVSTGIRSVTFTAHTETPTISVLPETSGVVQAMYYNEQVNGCSVATYAQSSVVGIAKARVGISAVSVTQRAGGCTVSRRSTGIYDVTWSAMSETPVISVLAETTANAQFAIANNQVGSCSLYIYAEPTAEAHGSVDVAGLATNLTGGCTAYIQTSPNIYSVRWDAHAVTPAVFVSAETSTAVTLTITNNSTTGCSVTVTTPDTTATGSSAFHVMAISRSVVPALTDVAFDIIAVEGDYVEPVLVDVPYSFRAESGNVVEPALINADFKIQAIAP